MNKNINYNVNNKIYNVIFTDDILSQLNNRFKKIKSDKKICLVYDENIDNKIIDELAKGLKTTGSIVLKKKIQSQKKNKNINVVIKLIDELNKNKFTKKSVIVACGGGVVGDLCGLVGSLYLRGMIFINIPTTMTSIVDSCIGGKTAVNHKNIINLIGSYYHPEEVFIYYKILKTLPDREYLAGLSEVIKCGLISKNGVLKKLNKNKSKFFNRDKNFLSEIILKTLKTKTSFFKNDVYEKNTRLFLNFGHTFVHAIEMATDKISSNDFLRHGEAVALGIICELSLSKLEAKNKRISKIIDNKLIECKRIFENFELPIKLPLKNSMKQNKVLTDIYKYVFYDKKKISDKPRYIKLVDRDKYEIAEIQNFDNINLSILEILN